MDTLIEIEFYKLSNIFYTRKEFENLARVLARWLSRISGHF